MNINYLIVLDYVILNVYIYSGLVLSGVDVMVGNADCQSLIPINSYIDYTNLNTNDRSSFGGDSGWYFEVQVPLMMCAYVTVIDKDVHVMWFNV
jgi:hypothetical protein